MTKKGTSNATLNKWKGIKDTFNDVLWNERGVRAY